MGGAVRRSIIGETGTGDARPSSAQRRAAVENTVIGGKWRRNRFDSLSQS